MDNRAMTVTEKEIQILMKHYSAYDRSNRGTEGIVLSDLLSMTEFTGNKFVANILQAHLHKETQHIHPQSFLEVLTLLSSKTPAEVKKKYLFQMLDVNNTGLLTYDEIFHIYKLLFSGAITDDHILDLTFRALQQPYLRKPGEISQEEFLKMIPDNEIMARLSIDFLPGQKL